MRQARRFLVHLLSSLLAIPVFIVVAAGPAVASPATCDPGELCVWSGIFAGAFDQVAQANLTNDPDLSNNSYDTDNSRFQNNTISSIWNRTGRFVRLFDLTGYRNAMVCVGPGVSLNLADRGWGDRTSSYTFGACA